MVQLCLATKYTWEDIATNFLQEFFDRCVLWMLDGQSGDKGELAYLEQDASSEYRLQTTLEAMKTSTRLLMFQVFFMKYVGRPEGATHEDILKGYDDRYGFPVSGMAVKLQNACKDFYKVKTWKNFYRRIEITPPTNTMTTSILREAVRRSERKGYHKNRFSQEQLFLLRQSKDPFVNQSDQLVEEVPKEVKNKAPLHLRKLFVGKLSHQVNDWSLAITFHQFGKVESAKVSLDAGGKSRRFGFVVFEEPEAAETAFIYNQGCQLYGKTISLQRVFGNNQGREAYSATTPNVFQEGKREGKQEWNIIVKKRERRNKRESTKPVHRQSSPSPVVPSVRSSNQFDFLPEEIPV